MDPINPQISLLVDNILSQQGSQTTPFPCPNHNIDLLSCYIFRFRVVAALVVCMLTMGPCHPRTLSGAPQSPATGRRGPESGVRRQNVISGGAGGEKGGHHHQCTEMRSQYLRSQCRDNGFLTVQRNRVLVQTTGLNTTHVEGRKIKYEEHAGFISSFMYFLSFLINGCSCKDYVWVNYRECVCVSPTHEGFIAFYILSATSRK